MSTTLPDLLDLTATPLGERDALLAYVVLCCCCSCSCGTGED